MQKGLANEVYAEMVRLDPNHARSPYTGLKWQSLYERAQVSLLPKGRTRTRKRSLAGQSAIDTDVWSRHGGWAVPPGMKWEYVYEDGQSSGEDGAEPRSKRLKGAGLSLPPLPPLEQIGVTGLVDFLDNVASAVKDKLFKTKKYCKAKLYIPWNRSWSAESLLGSYMLQFNARCGVTSLCKDGLWTVKIPSPQAFTIVFQMMSKSPTECVIPAKTKSIEAHRTITPTVKVIFCILLHFAYFWLHSTSGFFQVDFSGSNCVELKLRTKVIQETKPSDGKSPTKLGVCKGFQDKHCLSSCAVSETLYFTEGDYVCKDCNEQWEEETGRDSRLVETKTSETIIKRLQISFIITRVD